MANTILVIPDTQFPFHHENTFDFLTFLKKRFKPNIVVHLGDEVDFHCFGRWPVDPDGYGPRREFELALASMKRLYKLFPNVSVCTSNHTVRPLKRAFDAGLPSVFLKQYHEFLDAPKGWEWRDYFIYDDIRFEHGEGFAGQIGHIKAAQQHMRSTCIGHLHNYAGINYVACTDRLVFGFNVGCLIDHTKYAFAYGKKLPRKPILGAGIIKNGVPQFIPMNLDRNGKWTKKI